MLNLVTQSVVEALIDVKIEPFCEDENLLKSFGTASYIKKKFPQVLTTKDWKIQLSMQTGFESVDEGKIRGYFFQSNDKQTIAQVKMDGFTLNKLSSYSSWTNFRKEGKKLLNRYLHITKPKAVTRVALKYINLVSYETSSLNLGTYLNVKPQIGKKMQGQAIDFTMKVRLYDEKAKNHAIITEGIYKKYKKKDVITLVLDIDVFNTERRDVDENSLWRKIGELHKYKNSIFDASFKVQPIEVIK